MPKALRVRKPKFPDASYRAERWLEAGYSAASAIGAGSAG